MAAMLAMLEIEESGHPGDSWFTVKQIAKEVGADCCTVKRKCDELVEKGAYESCRRKIKRSNVTFYRLVPDRCSTKAKPNNPVRSSPTARIPSGMTNRIR